MLYCVGQPPTINELGWKENNMSSNVTVCCCDRFPGMHPCYKECRENEDDTIFHPTRHEIVFMRKCTEINHEDDGSMVCDGVCKACGTVVNEEEAQRAIES